MRATIMTSALPQPWTWRSRLRVTARLIFDTAWRIGSGREGEVSDLGVLLDASGQPLLPGSSLKGRLRSTCESLAPTLGLTACLLNSLATRVDCASDVQWYRDHREEYQDSLKRGPDHQLAWIDRYTCDVCKLFGSPVQAARLRCTDGRLIDSHAAAVRVRDGVVLDRDSHTAVDGLKYDYETVAAGAVFEIVLELDNPAPRDEALLGAALFEWCSGSSLGGFTSRGLGRFHLEQLDVVGVDFSNPEERKRYLTHADPAKKWVSRGNWERYFQDRISHVVESIASSS
jgi:CRISPR-associated RAMP protein (TIGR02581 family)